MTLAGRLALLLIASPGGMFAAHVIAYRALRAARRRPSAHSSAMVGIAACFIAFVVVGAAMTWMQIAASAAIAVAALAYLIATYAALSILYLDIVNIAETSLHMHLLLEIAWNDRLSMAELIDKYNPAHMVGERLERLTALGQVRREGDRYFLGNQSALRLSKTMDVWRRIIGLPTTPAEAQSER